MNNMGYEYFYDKKKVFIHRQVAEEIIGRKLEKDEVVHHLDGNKLNNNRRNIVVLLRADHARLHIFPELKLEKQDDGTHKVLPMVKVCEICSDEFKTFSKKLSICEKCYSLYRIDDFDETCDNKIKYICKKKRNRVKEDRFCLVCKNVLKNRRESKFCSQKCAHQFYYKCQHPSKEELYKLLWEMPSTKIAKMFGVSDKAICKWCKSYGIQKPPRGYWSKKNAGKL